MVRVTGGLVRREVVVEMGSWITEMRVVVEMRVVAEVGRVSSVMAPVVEVP